MFTMDFMIHVWIVLLVLLVTFMMLKKIVFKFKDTTSIKMEEKYVHNLSLQVTTSLQRIKDD